MAPHEIELAVNGRSTRVSAESTVAALVLRMVGEGVPVAVERNGEIVPRGAWGATSLASGDRIELVRFVQGG